VPGVPRLEGRERSRGARGKKDDAGLISPSAVEGRGRAVRGRERAVDGRCEKAESGRDETASVVARESALMGRSGIEVPEEQTGCDLTAGLRGTNGETDVSTNPTSSSSWPSPSSIRTSSDTDTVCEKDFLVLLSQLVVMALLAASCFPARIVGPDAVCGRCLATNWVNPRPTA
jgi:hypothetical protein